MNRTLWYAGVLLIVAGGTLVAVPLGGYSGLDSQSGLAGTPESDVPLDLVAIDAGVTRTESATPITSGTTTEGTAPDYASRNRSQRQNGTPVAALVNGADADVVVSYEASVDTDAVSLQSRAGNLTIPRGGQTRLFATCAVTEPTSGTAALTLSVSVFSSNDATIGDAVLDTRISYECPGTETPDA